MKTLLLPILLICFYSYSQDLKFSKPRDFNSIKNFDSKVINFKNNPLNGLSSWNIGFTPIQANIVSGTIIKIRVFMSMDSIISSNDIVVNEFTTNYCCQSCLTEHSCALYTEFDISCDNNLSSGSYYFILKLDADNKIIETNEANNVGYVQFNYKKETCGRVSAFLQNSKNNYTQGEPILLDQISFSNSSSDNFSLNNQLELYLSSDPNIDNSDYNLTPSSFFSLQNSNNPDPFCRVQEPFIGIPPYSLLNQNLFKPCNFPFTTIPNTLPNGNYYFLLRDPLMNTLIANYISVGNVTEIEKEETIPQLTKIKKIIDLTGRELAGEPTEGQVVIILFENNRRKLTKFYKENYINGF